MRDAHATVIPKTAPAKYIFLDVVGFTHDRSVEAQVDIVGYLNSIVTYALQTHSIDQSNSILLPTGDGMCIVLLGWQEAFDVHILLALDILRGLHEHNLRTQDKMRRFDVRIGINENVDNLVIDINNNRNVAGAGINVAQRVMTMADENNIFVSTTVFETLSQRERYLGAFKRHVLQIKHGQSLTGYQYIEEGLVGLNTQPPKAFQPKAPAARKPLPRDVAYYIAYSIANQVLVGSKERSDPYGLQVLHWFLAGDAVRKEVAPSYKPPVPRAPEGNTIHDQLEVIARSHFWLRAELQSYIEQVELDDYSDCFEREGNYRFVSDFGKHLLCSEHPDIANTFRISSE